MNSTEEKTHIKDKLIIGLKKASEYHHNQYPEWYITGITGIGSRISIAMNVKTGREIGHPSSSYIWDIVGYVSHCFTDIEIQYQLFIGSGYLNSARMTAAQNTNNNVKDVIEITSIDLVNDNLQPPFIYVNNNGEWNYSDINQTFEIEEFSNMPFGPVFLEIQEFTHIGLKKEFPVNTLRYIISTLERGEEPMELIGKGGYSAVSGWKAYARWMQAYSIPLANIKHNCLNDIPALLQQRREKNSRYWEYLSQELQKKEEVEFAYSLHKHYKEIAGQINEMKQSKTTYNDIKHLYFKEQEILPVYKKIKKYISQNEYRKK